MSDNFSINPSSSNCSGCGACLPFCKVGCISMGYSNEGFAVAEVDQETCTGCGACLKICPFSNSRIRKNPLKTYAFREHDLKELKQSASGGAFFSLASEFVRRGGYVCSAVDDVESGGYFCLSNQLEDVQTMRGSKYYYIDLSQEIIHKILKLVKDGEKVLFCGLPCQAYAVRSIVGSSSNLVTVDLVCQGAPSEKVIKAYRKQEEKHHRSRLIKHAFRSKKDSYSGYTAELTYENGAVESFHGDLNLYTCSFQHRLFLREACYQCPFSTEQRVGDITIGDFWGIETFQGEPAKKSISLILLNNEDFFDLLSSLSIYGDLEERSLSEAIDGNAPLRHPCKRPFMRSVSFKLLDLVDFKASVALCYPKYFAKRLIQKKRY